MKAFTLCIAIVLGALTCGWAGQDTITIGVSRGLSCQFSSIGEIQQKGYRLWQSRVNSDGGTLNKKVRVIILDNHSNPHLVFQLYQNFISGSQVDFIFGTCSGVLTEVAASIAERHRYPLLVAGAAVDRIWQKSNDYRL